MSTIMKLLTSGVKKMAKRTKPKDSKKISELNDAALLDKEIDSLERLLQKTKNEKVRNSLKEQLVKLKYQARKSKKAPTKAELTAKTASSGKGVGSDVKKRKPRAKPMAEADEDLQDLPAFLRPQAGLTEPKGKLPKKPKMLKKQAY